MTLGKTALLAAVALATVPVFQALASPTPVHDPRTTAKKLSQGLEVDGAGKLAIDYKALHYNEPNFKRAKGNDRFLSYLNGNVWGKMGTAKLDFPITSGDVKLAKGSYTFGLNMTKDDEFSVVFWQGDKKIALPLESEFNEKRQVAYLTIALMATEDIDTFVIEVRCGPYTATTEIKVPYLDPDHDEHDDGEHGDGGR